MTPDQRNSRLGTFLKTELRPLEEILHYFNASSNSKSGELKETGTLRCVRFLSDEIIEGIAK